MAQLSFDVPDEIESAIRNKAKLANMSLREYLIEIVKQESGVEALWPESYIALFDDWQGEPLERPSQLD